MRRALGRSANHCYPIGGSDALSLQDEDGNGSIDSTNIAANLTPLWTCDPRQRRCRSSLQAKSAGTIVHQVMSHSHRTARIAAAAVAFAVPVRTLSRLYTFAARLFLDSYTHLQCTSQVYFFLQP